MHPRQRTANLVVSPIGNDLVIFDEQNSHLHTLPAPLAAVWQACDGTADLLTIAQQTGLTEVQVEAALHQLCDAGLVTPDAVASLPSSRDRRDLLKRALGVALVSVTAPMAAQAQSGTSIACATFPSVLFQDYCAYSEFGTYDCPAEGCPAETWFIYNEYSYLYDEMGSFVTDTSRSQCEGEDGTIIATTPWTPVDASVYPFC